ncbi:hypothetical protein D3C71_1328040 [compost metagenome]
MFRCRHANTKDVTGRKAGGPGKRRVQAVDIGAFPAEITAFQHVLHITDAAAGDIGIAEGVFDDPVIDGAGLVLVFLTGADDLHRRILDDAVDRRARRGDESGIKFGL